MTKIIQPKRAIEIARKLRNQNRKIVLVGGVFDILHIGHIKFLEKAKQKGDILFVLLESDETTSRLKGSGRPVNTQDARARVVSTLAAVDYVVKLTEMKNNNDYDRLVTQLNPNILAVTKNDKNIKHKMRQARIVGAQVLSVVSYISNQSTTRFVEIMKEKDS